MGIVKTIPTGSNYNPSSATATGIGTVSNVTTTSFEVSNITIPQIAASIGSSAMDLTTLSTSANINQWALYRPDKATPHGIDEWAGYNKNAKPPSYFYYKDSSISAGKTSTFLISFAATLARGERLPLNNSSASYWNYVRAKAVINDTTNNRTLTAYSSIQAITQGITTFNITYTDNNRYDFSGNVTISAEYVDSAGGLVHGQIEDTSYNIPISVTGYWNWRNLSDFNYNPYADGLIRLYYYNGTSLTFISLSQAQSTAPRMIFHSGMKSVGSTMHAIYYTTDTPSGGDFPVMGGGMTHQWVVISYNGQYYKYTVTPYTTNQVFDTEYKVGATVSKMFRLNYVSVHNVWPTTYS